MTPLLAWSLLVFSVSLSNTNAQATTSDPNLVGTWASKSGTVMTGPVSNIPDFYDPVNDHLKEPQLPGSSFSFTADGYFEEARYIVISNPAKPQCPKALLQWQHGKYVLYSNGTIVLTPIKIDGRQIYSDPCQYKMSIYTRYNQTETYKWYEVLTDERRGKKRLNLYQFDGAPMNPMYLEYNPPQMLPTVTLDPLITATGTAAKAKATAAKKIKLKRDLPGSYKKAEDINADHVLWLGIGLTGLGLVGYLCV
ncbi:chaperone for protein-folding within the ER, fungal-domain-containing protein [Trichophaea hybrida]|nr:chaperone for protein-folding within the ER, fungal-domain-containing protein [Trichophaea hybrida]